MDSILVLLDTVKDEDVTKLIKALQEVYASRLVVAELEKKLEAAKIKETEAGKSLSALIKIVFPIANSLKLPK